MPAYMSPEQVRGQNVDRRSDVWAFGCVVYQMVTAHPAFARATMAETLTAILEHEPDWERLPSSLPPGVRRLLRRCLEKDPRRRLHHIADARIEIDDGTIDADKITSGVLAPHGRWVPLLSAIALTLALAAPVAWLVRPAVYPTEPRVVEITMPWTSDLWAFAVSPDGRRIAYVADDGGAAGAVGASTRYGGRTRVARHRTSARPVLVAR